VSGKSPGLESRKPQTEETTEHTWSFTVPELLTRGGVMGLSPGKTNLRKENNETREQH